MAWLALLLLTFLFVGLHVVPFAPALRGRLVAAVGGEKPYMGLYAIASLVGLFGAFFAAGAAPVVPLWYAGDGLRWAALVLTLAAFVLLASAYVGTAGPRLARHPMLAGIGLWALAHLLTNGELAHLLLFGALALYAPAAMVASDRRDARRDPEAFAARAEATSLVPFAALLRGGVGGMDWKGPAGGVVAWAAFLALHARLFGVSPWPTALF
jgi:uncharacterized membrane protein